MSRGPGCIQRYVFVLLRDTKKPMTFAEILACAYPAGTFNGDMAKALGGSNVGGVRSLRRALHKMVKDGVVVELGKGGRECPHHYYFHPVLLVQLFEKSEMRAICEEMDRIEAG
jgi:hypothetical protein